MGKTENTATGMLRQHRSEFSRISLSDLFAQDHDRARKFSAEGAGLLLDFSKNFCTGRTLALFEQLAGEIRLRDEIEALFEGREVNGTEHRPALHTALRAQDENAPLGADVRSVLQRMRALVADLREGRRTGYSNKTFTDIVNIGIGGSDLGPRCVVAALRHLDKAAPRVHFVANIDPVELGDTLAALNPETTLVIAASKSFTTLETLSNSRAAIAWLRAAAGQRAIDEHLVAITANPERAAAIGVAPHNVFPMWDWVGGRYSLWSAIGLPIACALGWEQFSALLRGGNAMDEHYRNTPFRANLPFLLAMFECWYSADWNAHSSAVLPYSHRLRLFPAFLQQLSMESLGKSVDRRGAPLTQHSGLVVWGEPGSNSQHSFMQLLHQGTRFVPVDFIAVARPENSADAQVREQHTHLLANCLSQARALLTGRSLEEVLDEADAAGLDETEALALAPHKVMSGNRPSNLLLLDALSAERLGALIALYEHKVHAQSIIWNINAFDQWGVELGKQSAREIFAALGGAPQTHLDASTLHLIERLREVR